MTIEQTGLQALMTFKAVAAATGISRTTMKRMTEAGTFPRPVRLGGKVAYVSSEIKAWIDTRIAERDEVAA